MQKKLLHYIHKPRLYNTLRHYPLCNSVTRVYSITWISVGDMEPRYEDLVHGAEHRAREVIERSI